VKVLHFYYSSNNSTRPPGLQSLGRIAAAMEQQQMQLLEMLLPERSAELTQVSHPSCSQGRDISRSGHLAGSIWNCNYLN
jgi:hypothetical protein